MFLLKLITERLRIAAQSHSPGRLPEWNPANTGPKWQFAHLFFPPHDMHCSSFERHGYI